MSQQRPALKLKFGSLSSAPKGPDSTGTDGPGSATSPPGSGTPKMTLKFGKTPTTSTPTSAKSSSAKPARKPKPSAKKRDSKKGLDDSDSEKPLAAKSAPRPKKLKLTARSSTAGTQGSAGGPLLKIKARGRPPPRPLGVGYDSEASDREEDPTITDNFILRFPPVADGGKEDCEYVRQAVKDRRFGPVREGGADIRLRFLTKDARRAMLTVRGRMYAAILVDLPCILEAMKSWERKSWWKSGDVWQMLLVLGRCKSEEEATNYPLPTKRGELNEKTWQWAHGVSPPMRWVRKRRFRKRISVRAVEEDEKEVDRLLEADDECVPGTSKWHLYENVEEYEREQSMLQDDDSEDDDDAEGEEDAEGEMDLGGADPDAMDEDDDIFAAEMEKAMAEHAAEDNAGGTPAEPTAAPKSTSATIPSKPSQEPTSTPVSAPSSPAITNLQLVESPGMGTGTSSGASDEEEDSPSDEESDEDAPAVDRDEVERQNEVTRQREEIGDLEAAIAREKDALSKTANAILRSKIARKIEGLQGDLEVRKRALGEDSEED